MRDQFIIPEGGPYFLTHSTGPLTVRGLKYLRDSYLTPWTEKGGNVWPEWLVIIDRFRAGLGKLFVGEADDFCPQQNVSSGLTKYLLSLPGRKGPIKVLMHGHAFPSMGFVVQALRSAGHELVLIPGQLPASDINVWAEHLTDDIGAVLITHVHSNTGAVSPVKEIAATARAKDVRTLVDVAQSNGIMPINLKDWNADAVFGSCVKWLSGGPGAGWMWVNPERADDLTPIDVGWFSHEDPFEFDIHNFRYAGSAKKFWGGTPSIAPYALALGGVETILEIGIDKMRAHNLELMQTVLPDRNFSQNGGTICFDADDRAEALSAKLTAENAFFDRRDNTLRLSLHITNTAEEAQMLRDLLVRD
ncbi:MAG: aminotransferase class V-fold PLP-dependent enzyme [Hellea sp.]|nr:aminotransferase class V-fold PLP-dependent enzyme [Hellea sp.]